ncbi:3644_t:CDS:1 [Ambispora gerdemannii]|uniref:3644_t:CDS:1 n=1 Tax=Ambispora gerdemannii TaxID=144530 RepID=A0A9N9FQX0_9GLOM|nr:3644_t:CDS:1 [Ambispora gerdemannii]
MDEEVYDQVLKFEDELYKEEEWESDAERQMSDSQDLLLSHVYYNSKLTAPNLAQSNNKSSGNSLVNGRSNTLRTSSKEGELLMTPKPKNNKQQYDSSISTYSRDRKGKSKVDVDEFRTPSPYTTARNERFVTPEPKCNNNKSNNAHYDSTSSRVKGKNKVDEFRNPSSSTSKQIKDGTHPDTIIISDDSDIEASAADTTPSNRIHHSSTNSTSIKTPETDSKYAIGRTKVKNSKASTRILGSKKRIQLGDTSDSYSSSDNEYKLSIQPTSVLSTPSTDPTNSTTITNTTNTPEGIFVKEIITPVTTPSRFMKPTLSSGEYNLPERSPLAKRNNKASNNNRYFNLPPRYCRTCNESGHLEQNCTKADNWSHTNNEDDDDDNNDPNDLTTKWKYYVYIPNSVDGPDPGGPSPVCYQCGGRGHYGDDCPGKKVRGKDRRNHASKSTSRQDDRSKRRRRQDDYDRYDPYYSSDGE